MLIYLALHLVDTVSSQLSSVNCKFENTLCGWEAEAPWVLTDRTFLPNALNLSPFMLVGDGSFMTAQGYFGSNTTADLVSPYVHPSAALGILSLKYTKTQGNAVLQIMIKEGGNYRNLDTIASNAMVLWIRRTIVVPATTRPYQVVFRVSKLGNGFDAISVDDVFLRTTARTVLSADQSHVDAWPSRPLIEIGELRRSPKPNHNDDINYKRQDAVPRCKVKCSFDASACSWSPNRWKLLPGKIATEGQADALLVSEPVLLPMNAHFELDVVMSESSAFSVYQKFGAEESLVWTQSGIPLAGWNRIRLPLRLSPLPSKFEIRASTKPGQFVAVTNTNIVDGNGRDLACGGDLQVIRPHNGDLIRLTAVQKLESTDAEDVKVPKLYVMSTTTSMPTVEPLRRTSLTSPDVVSAPATYKDQRQSAQFAALPISPAIVSSARLRGSTLYSTGAAAALPEEKGNPKSIPAPTKLTTSAAPVVASSRNVPLFQELLDRVAGQPFLADQLKFLAKKYDVDGMLNVETGHRLQEFQRVLNGPGSSQRPVEKRPIQPTNGQSAADFRTAEEVLKFSSAVLPSTKLISSTLKNKLSQLLSPPQDHGDDSKPFSRSNMDFVIQNAYNAYVNQARPKLV